MSVPGVKRCGGACERVYLKHEALATALLNCWLFSSYSNGAGKGKTRGA